MTARQITTAARILVCESVRATMTEISKALSQAGYRVLEARSAQRMMQLLAKDHPDLILCNTQLAGADGIELLRFIRQSCSAFDDVPILMLSDQATPAHIAAGRRAGADDHLTLPVDGEVLVAAIIAHLRQSERLRRAEPLRDQAPRPAAGLDLLAAYKALTQRFSFGIVLMNSASQPIFMNDAAQLMTGRDTRTIRDWLARTAGLSITESSMFFRRPGHQDCRGTTLLSHMETGHLSGPLLVTVKPLYSDDMQKLGTAILLYSPHEAKDHGVCLIAEAVGLTPSETNVAQLLSQGKRTQEITQELAISRPTVNFHLHNIFCKTATSRQTELVALLHCAQLRI